MTSPSLHGRVGGRVAHTGGRVGHTMRRAPGAPPRRGAIRLLEHEPDLGARLDAHAFAEARRDAILPTHELDVGAWELDDLRRAGGVAEPVHGFLVLHGALTFNVSLVRRRCARLLAAGEIVLLDAVASDALPMTWGWTTLMPARLAVLDQRLLVIGRRWPALMSEILKRAALQTRQAHTQQAISQLPRVEDRLLALFWTLADRAGIARTDGIFVPLNLTHDTIAAMIGARRPTVSLGLGSLSDQGRLVRHDHGWLLDPASLETLRA